MIYQIFLSAQIFHYQLLNHQTEVYIFSCGRYSVEIIFSKSHKQEVPWL